MNLLPERELLMALVSVDGREAIARARETACRGNLLAGLDLLDTESREKSHTLGSPGWLAVLMARAELFFLDLQLDAARSIFQQQIFPAREHLSPLLTYIAARNAAEVDLARRDMQSAREYLNLSREIEPNATLLDFKLLLQAEDNAAEGKHYDALQVLEVEFARTQYQAVWGPSRDVARRLSFGLMRVGQLSDAAYYAILSGSHEATAAVGVSLMKRRDAHLVRESVLRILSLSNLLTHFAAACELLAVIGDAIADTLVDTVAQWLLPRCSLPVHDRTMGTSHPLNMAWRALEPVAHRVSPTLARSVLHAATTHEAWTRASSESRVFPERRQMVRTMNHCLSALQEKEDFRLLAQTGIPLATTLRQNYDYPDVIDFLCHLADRGGDEIKSSIGDQLFVAGKVPYLLGQVASHFGKQFLPPDKIPGAAAQITRAIRLQVQRLGPNDEPLPVPGGILTHTAPRPEGRIVTTVVQGVELYALAQHRDQMPGQSLRELVEASIYAITDPENFLTNRATTIQGIVDFVDKMPSDLVEKLRGVLEPLARGEVKEPTTPGSAADDSLLGHSKTRFGTVAEVRGTALVALARIEKHWPARYGTPFQPILEESLTAPDADVRRFAFSAARDVPELSEAAIMAVLLGTRDPEPSAAAAAFTVLATRSGLTLSYHQWLLVLYAAKMALQEPSTLLRRRVASAIANFQRQPLSPEIRPRVVALLEECLADVCASVRTAAGRKEEL